MGVGVPVRDKVPGVLEAGGCWDGLGLRARMPGVRRRGGMPGWVPRLDMRLKINLPTTNLWVSVFF
jgi:hypothetical protein